VQCFSLRFLLLFSIITFISILVIISSFCWALVLCQFFIYIDFVSDSYSHNKRGMDIYKESISSKTLMQSGGMKSATCTSHLDAVKSRKRYEIATQILQTRKSYPLSKSRYSYIMHMETNAITVAVTCSLKLFRTKRKSNT